ncbi:hypothetical protein A2392_01115 [Candidatus Kaiserbacteria bacterium RIFOXYB1_FULL_46_14]|uniref:Uncharacterized protein n=1 Tax=Candidatus Kaiserbacteria bacterium RIFOXYB1_FULL_46_14 TaxID=1798531 RepID=A0A1F6FJN0_9BACT|nr:MAG: hypothetical protein A2392_01115 [Candidatus Kaiserbacteria bacterium RIFOXYB1_FULL_46_14]
MKKFLNIFFVALGGVFFCLLMVGALLFILDSYQIRPMVTDLTGKGDTSETTADKNPALSPTQEKTLETFGIDPASVPSSITPEQEACFIEILGEARVTEIKNGDSPTMTEYLKAKACI